ncbi:hypothetical protein JW835_15700 [bacterium]|nr:hypothetical protein [bacterium]
MKKTILYILTGIVFFGAGFSLFAQQDIKVIVQKDMALTEIDRNTFQRIYLGKNKFWKDGSAIVAVHLRGGPAHEVFLKDFINRTDSKFRSYWNWIVFTGRGVPLRSFENEAELIQYVAETPGAIGYVSSETNTDNVKVISVN